MVSIRAQASQSTPCFKRPKNRRSFSSIQNLNLRCPPLSHLPVFPETLPPSSSAHSAPTRAWNPSSASPWSVRVRSPSFLSLLHPWPEGLFLFRVAIFLMNWPFFSSSFSPSLALLVSGEVPEEPVLSKKSGLLFERRLIQRHIAVGLPRFSVCDFPSFPVFPTLSNWN